MPPDPGTFIGRSLGLNLVLPMGEVDRSPRCRGSVLILILILIERKGPRWSRRFAQHEARREHRDVEVTASGGSAGG